MKLLFDENLSVKLVRLLKNDFTDSTHVDLVHLRGASDCDIWKYAQHHDLVLVTKDDDFRNLSFLYGQPPKVIWLSVGNASTDRVAAILRMRKAAIFQFIAAKAKALLVLHAAFE